MSRAPLAQLGRGFLTLGAGEISARIVAFLAAAYISGVVTRPARTIIILNARMRGHNAIIDS